MTLQQMRYIVAVARNGFNITQAAASLHTSQPGVSKQIRQLEDELGVEIFVRRGKSLEGLTAAGRELLERAERINREIEDIRQLSQDLRGNAAGALRIGTTQTQATYVLPDVIGRFRERFREVTLDLHQGTSEQLAVMLSNDDLDFVIASDGWDLFPDVVKLPCYHWHRILVVPENHELADEPCPSLERLAGYPLVSYTLRSNARSSMLAAFRERGLEPNLVFTARDADVIKTYVRSGTGVGIIAAMAWQNDVGLTALSARELFPRCTTWIGYRRGRYLRRYMKEFVEAFAPHIDHLLLEQADLSASQREIDELFGRIALSVRDTAPPCPEFPL
ncbi:MAG: LysR substrate-binding domain-containing protein [Xanthomonadales bacterium]|nr:LysR substrate-binding domain-containing protein [Xanthomonadales bacterium]